MQAHNVGSCHLVSRPTAAWAWINTLLSSLQGLAADHKRPRSVAESTVTCVDVQVTMDWHKQSSPNASPTESRRLYQ